jgi:hypothetical protein
MAGVPYIEPVTRALGSATGFGPVAAIGGSGIVAPDSSAVAL